MFFGSVFVVSDGCHLHDTLPTAAEPGRTGAMHRELRAAADDGRPTAVSERRGTMVHAMSSIWRTALLYALLLAGAAFLLQWLEYRYLVRRFSTEAYIVVIALVFAAVGAWVGNRLTTSRTSSAFEVNQQAIAQLGLSQRELEVLQLLADGQSNKEMACRLSLSPNTIKTHLANLYGKLDANRRTQAVSKAGALSIIP